jgi:hypothetical protein
LAATTQTSQRWFFGPVPDLILGCGAGYVALMAILLVPLASSAFAPWVALTVAAGTLLLNAPHYGATLLRISEDPEDRHRYGFFTLCVTAVMGVLLVAGLHAAWLGSLLLTAYITWSPWHFAGQNYGLGLMFLRRRGVAVPAGPKKLLYASFLLSFLLTFLTMHGSIGTLSVAPLIDFPNDVYRFRSLGIPDPWIRVALPLVATGYVVVLGTWAFAMLRQASPGDLGPTVALIGLQALWFSIPSALAFFGLLTSSSLVMSTFWIAFAHSIQYLWVTAYYAKRSEPSFRMAGYLGKTLLAGMSLTIFPTVLFAPGLLGTIPFQAGMGALVFSVVNLHHFILDGAIWKLRDGRIAGLLLRSGGAQGSVPVTPASGFGRHAVRRMAWCIGALSLVVAVVNLWEMEFGYRRALETNDVGRMLEATRRMHWIGRDSAGIHNNLAVTLARNGARRELVQEHFRRSIEIFPTAQAWIGLGISLREEGEAAKAVDAFEAALALAPDNLTALLEAGQTRLELGEFQRARTALDHAAELDPKSERIRSIQLQLERAASRPPPVRADAADDALPEPSQ